MTADRRPPDDLLDTLAASIWEHTGAEGDCPDDGAYEQCAACLAQNRIAAAQALEALAAYADGALLDPNGWRRVDAGPAEWHCEAEAVGADVTPCDPSRPAHMHPCGWLGPLCTLTERKP